MIELIGDPYVHLKICRVGSEAVNADEGSGIAESCKGGCDRNGELHDDFDA